MTPADIAGLTIAGVDGGYVSRRFIGFDIFLFRAVAVFSSYTPTGIQKTTYYPAKTPPFETAVSEVGLSVIDAEQYGTIRRAITEIQVALQVLEVSPKKVDILLLDGSPVIKKPLTGNQKILRYYQTYLNHLARLVSQTREDRIRLAWIVKDSRLNLLTKFLGRILPFLSEEIPEMLAIDYRSIINRSRDMDLFFYLLEPNARSLVYHYPFQLPIDSGLDLALYVYYLKTAPYDIPLRIELFQSIPLKSLANVNEVNILSEAILPISQYNREYGIPAPIVEADARARIKETEVDALFRSIHKKHPTPDLWFPRRERTPWRF
ncbi:MAG: DNA double-strand break repair nuclease NurA [Candidatus Heimdallarchaeota archaeon]